MDLAKGSKYKGSILYGSKDILCYVITEFSVARSSRFRLSLQPNGCWSLRSLQPEVADHCVLCADLVTSCVFEVKFRNIVFEVKFSFRSKIQKCSFRSRIQRYSKRTVCRYLTFAFFLDEIAKVLVRRFKLKFLKIFCLKQSSLGSCLIIRIYFSWMR